MIKGESDRQFSPAKSAEGIPLSQRRKMVSDIRPEAEFQVHLKALLERMGANWVEIRQGSDELGKDVLASFPSKFGQPDIVAVVAKLGKVSGRVTGSTALAQVLHQVDQAFVHPAPTTKEGRDVQVTKVIVACTGDFSGNARIEIAARAKRENRQIVYWDREEIADKFFEYLPEFFVDLDKDEHDYLCDLQVRVCDLNKEMRRYGRSMDFELDHVFVDPRVAVLEKARRVEGRRVKKGKSGLVVDINSGVQMGGIARILERSDSILVMGPAGSGKSTLLKKAALEQSKSRRVRDGVQAELPCWLSARKLARVDPNDELVESLLSAFEGEAPPAHVLQTALRKTGLTLYIDEIEAVAMGDGEERLQRWLERLSTTGRVRVLASTRVAFFDRPIMLKNFSAAIIFPFGTQAIRRLLEKMLDKERAAKVLHAFLRQDQASTLPRTPLVVTLLAMLHQQEHAGEIPANIAELYRMVSEVYLGKWSDQVGDTGLEQYALLSSVVRVMAFHMQEKRTWWVNKRTAIKVVTDFLHVRGRHEDADTILKGLLETGMLVRKDGSPAQDIGFVDRTFQEFFCASYLHDQPRLVDAAAKRFSDPWWMNVVTFLAGLRRDAPDLIGQVIRGTYVVEPRQALLTSLQIGYLLQAASMSPTANKIAGIKHATDLVQYFYAYYAKQLDEARVGIQMSRTSLILGASVLFAMAFHSRHLEIATEDASMDLLASFESANGDERFIRGMRALCAATALACQGNYSALTAFAEAVSKEDAKLLHSLACIVESTAPDGDASQEATKAWNDLVRTSRRIIERSNGTRARSQRSTLAAFDRIREIPDSIRPLEDEPHLIDAKGTQLELPSSGATVSPK